MKKIVLSFFFIYQCFGSPPPVWNPASLRLGAGAALVVTVAGLRTTLLLCNSYENSTDREFCTMAGINSSIVGALSAFMLTLCLIDIHKLPNVIPLKKIAARYNLRSRK